MRKVDMLGRKFGLLTVVEEAEERKDGKVCWICKCDCGNECTVIGKNLRNGNTQSCGCMKKSIGDKTRTHGMRNTRLYKIWHDMKRRCYDKRRKAYERYGGKGIQVCDEWKNDFMAFYNWAMDNGYQENLTIDRIDNDGNYEPSNCRWATQKEQQNNRTNNRYVTYEGETMTVAQMEQKHGIPTDYLRSALSRGETAEQFINRFKGSRGEYEGL